MKNKTLINETKKYMISLLQECTEQQVLTFKKMYSHKNLDVSIEEVVENMDSHKLDWATSQIERTLGLL